MVKRQVDGNIYARLSECFAVTHNQSFLQHVFNGGNLQSEWYLVIREL